MTYKNYEKFVDERLAILIAADAAIGIAEKDVTITLTLNELKQVMLDSFTIGEESNK